MHQKFRLHMIGHYNRLCHIIMCNTQRNVGPKLFVHNENSAYVMPCVTAHAVTSCAHCAACARRPAGHPMYMWHTRNYLSTLCTPKIQNSVHFQNLVSPEPSIFCYSGCFHRILHKILHNIGHGGAMIQQSFLQCLYSVKMHEFF